MMIQNEQEKLFIYTDKPEERQTLMVSEADAQILKKDQWLSTQNDLKLKKWITK